MSRKYIIFFCLNALLFLCVFHVIAQRGKTLDSLFTLANKPTADTHAVKAMIEIQRTFFNQGSYDSSYYFAHKALAMATALKHAKWMAYAQFGIGLSSTNRTMYDTATYYLLLAKNAAFELKDSLLLVRCYNTFGILFRYQSDYSKSLENSLAAVSIAEASTQKDLQEYLPKIYNTVAAALYGEYQWSRGIEYDRKVLLCTGYPDEDRMRALANMGISDAFVRLKQYDSAKVYLDGALASNAKLNNMIIKLLVANTEGFYYQNIGEYQKALIAYLKAYAYSDSTQNDYLKSNSADNAAFIYFKLKQFDLAKKFALESSTMALRFDHFIAAASAFNTLKEVSVALGDFKTALYYAELNRQYEDSNTNVLTKKNTLTLESKYQAEKKQKEISDLKVLNAEKELSAVKRNRIFLLGIIGAISIIVVLGLLYRNSNNKKVIAENEQNLQKEHINFLERQQQIVSLQSMVNGQETERTRIAKDLHDGLGGLFSTVKMYFSTLEHEQQQLKDNELFKKSYIMVDNAATEVRRIAHNMMPEVLLKLGLANALQDLCNNITASRLIQVSLQINGLDRRLNAGTEIMLYRIIQELLNNIVKHAEASEAIVQFIQNGNHLSVTVEDNGRGFNTADADLQKKAGIENIKNRVDYLNGSITIESAKNLGTTVMMDFLLNDNA